MPLDPEGELIQCAAFGALATASLVSRAWNTICRQYMFRRFDASDENLAFLHFEAPHLSEYIRELHLWWNNDECTASEWLPECFCRLKNLREVHLGGGISQLSTVPAALGAGIVIMLAAPRLRKLLLRGWSFSGVSGLLSLFPVTPEALVLIDISATDDEVKASPSTIRLEA